MPENKCFFLSYDRSFTTTSTTVCLGNKNEYQAYTTYPSEHDGMLTDTFSPVVCECAFISLIFRWISFSDFGAFIFTEPKYVTPENSVQS